MKRMAFVFMLIALGVLLMQSGARAYQVWPARLLTALNQQQQFEFFQALVVRGYDQQSAARIAQNAIAIQPPGRNARQAQILVLEDQPGEIGPLGVVVVGDTVEDADIFQIDGDGVFSGPARDILQLSFGGAAIFQGRPSINELLRLFVRLRFVEPRPVFQQFTIPPGRHDVQFSTGAQPPLDNLRFIMIGSPELKISRIVGVNQGMPDIVFNPPATPFEVTLRFVQRPLFNCPSTDFIFSVTNGGTRNHEINIGSIFR